MTGATELFRNRTPMRSVLRSLLLVLALLVSAPAARAQVPAGGYAPAETSTAVVAPAQSGGLPARPAPPRTLRDHWHVFIAFALAWLLLFGYVVSVGRRFAKVEEEIRRAGA